MTTEKKNTEAPVQADERVYKLSRPVVFEGQEITELNLDFEDLDGNDLLVCTKQARRIDAEEMAISPIRATTISYQVAVSARAANVVPELIQALKAADFSAVTQRAANFLLAQG